MYNRHTGLHIQRNEFSLVLIVCHVSVPLFNPVEMVQVDATAVDKTTYAIEDTAA